MSALAGLRAMACNEMSATLGGDKGGQKIQREGGLGDDATNGGKQRAHQQVPLDLALKGQAVGASSDGDEAVFRHPSGSNKMYATYRESGKAYYKCLWHKCEKRFNTYSAVKEHKRRASQQGLKRAEALEQEENEERAILSLALLGCEPIKREPQEETDDDEEPALKIVEEEEGEEGGSGRAGDAIDDIDLDTFFDEIKREIKQLKSIKGFPGKVQAEMRRGDGEEGTSSQSEGSALEGRAEKGWRERREGKRKYTRGLFMNEKVSRKREQNKFASRRYREKKKEEVVEAGDELQRLENEYQETVKRLRDSCEERNHVLGLIHEFYRIKSNPGFVIRFPEWFQPNEKRGPPRPAEPCT